MSGQEPKMGQVWLASGGMDEWRVTCVDGHNITLVHERYRNAIVRTREHVLGTFTLVKPAPESVSAPQVIVGRFASRPDVEWSVAVGGRFRFRPNGMTYVVQYISATQISLVRPGQTHIWDESHKAFWLNYEPAPRESRWLDPASVHGRGQMQLCCVGSALTYVERCKWPAQIGDDPAVRCAYHAEHPGVWERSPSLLPPSALTPAPRWKHKPPRVRHTNLAYIRCGDQEDEGSNFVFHAPRKNFLVRKVREGVRVSPAGATSAGWTAV